MNQNCWKFTKTLLLLSWFAVAQQVYPQKTTPTVLADFSMPDTVCLNDDITISNLSQGATTYFWKFCTGDPLTNMQGIDLGNPAGDLNVPLGVTLVQDNGNLFAFIANSGNGTVTKISWGNSFFNQVTVENMGNFGLLTSGIFGIQVKFDAGKWYGFVTNGNQLVRLNLGSSLSVDALSAQVVATSAFMNRARGLVIEKDGADWVGFCTNYPAKTIARFHWQNGLGGTNPDVADLGFVNILTDPMQPALIRDNSGWYMFVANTNSLAQFDFGNSLMNLPTATDFKNLAWMTDDRGISLFMECNNPYGFVTNHNLVDNLILQINFKGGMTGSKSITPLGMVANMYLPLALSESLNIGDTVYTIVVNESSLTTLFFPPCINSPLPPSTQFDPSPVKFDALGKYTVKLTVDMGLPTEQTVCREIYVDAPSVIDLGNDTTLCSGISLQIDAGPGFLNYQWNTGATTRKIMVDTAGIYTVRASNTTFCHADDSIKISFAQPATSEVDTTICSGQRYFAGGQWRMKSGSYVDSLFTKYLCDSLVTTNLTVKPPVIVSLGNDTCIFSDNIYTLHPQGTGITGYVWQDSSQDSVFTVREPGSYWVIASIEKCSGTDTVIVKPCPSLIFFPTAFTPNGDNLNDYFKPKGSDIREFYMVIFDRWGHMVFETHDPAHGWDGKINGIYAEPGVYTYMASYAGEEVPPETRKVSGTLTIVR
jgi:gliding motility-associated-like protein